MATLDKVVAFQLFMISCYMIENHYLINLKNVYLFFIKNLQHNQPFFPPKVVNFGTVLQSHKELTTKAAGINKIVSNSQLPATLATTFVFLGISFSWIY